MLDGALAQTRLERASGSAAVTVGPRGLQDLRQVGSAKAMLPRMHGGPSEVVFLNTAGGVTDGDSLAFALSAQGAAVTGTTQTAERAYRSASDRPAAVDVTLTAGPGAVLHWLPQETILYDGAALSRTTRAEIAEDAELVLLDLLVLGRIAMGEEVRRLTLTDRREVWRGARPVLIDPVALTAGDLARPDPSGLAGARAVGALHLIAADAEDRLARLRNLLPGDGSAAASAWDGRLSARFLARDPAALRAVLARALPGLTGRPLPRVWPR